MKRVLCLYKVSSPELVDSQEDISRQRRECHDFIKRMDGWERYCERTVKGDSEYQVYTKYGNVMSEIRRMAERREFDVLLGFMTDSLCRNEEEAKLLLEWFTNHGIEVWSTQEGQQKLNKQKKKWLKSVWALYLRRGR